MLRTIVIGASILLSVSCNKESSGYEAEIYDETLVEYNPQQDDPESDLARFNQLAAAFGGPQLTRRKTVHETEQGAMANNGHRRTSPASARR